MRVTSVTDGGYSKDPYRRQTLEQGQARSHLRCARIIDLVDLSPEHHKQEPYPAWLETYIALLPDDVAAERTRNAFHAENDGFVEKLLLEIW